MTLAPVLPERELDSSGGELRPPDLRPASVRCPGGPLLPAPGLSRPRAAGRRHRPDPGRPAGRRPDPPPPPRPAAHPGGRPEPRLRRGPWRAGRPLGRRRLDRPRPALAPGRRHPAGRGGRLRPGRVCCTTGWRHGDAWRYTPAADDRPFLGGGTLLYRRRVWARTPFPEIDVGEDAAFVAAIDPVRLLALHRRRLVRRPAPRRQPRPQEPGRSRAGRRLRWTRWPGGSRPTARSTEPCAPAGSVAGDRTRRSRPGRRRRTPSPSPATCWSTTGSAAWPSTRPSD